MFRKIIFRFSLLLAAVTGTSKSVSATEFNIAGPSSKVSIVYAPDGRKLDSITASLLANDIQSISGYKPMVTKDISKVRGNVIIIGSNNTKLIRSLKDNYFKQLDGKWECFSYKVVNKPFKNVQQALVITGSDPRGTAFGVFELSKKLGVSPWYWWADVKPPKKEVLTLNINPFISETPSVKYRGIFINDEDWGLQPWAAKNFEQETGDIGPKTYEKVFELMLRLKANLIWPAMHSSTKPFFYYPGNEKIAAAYEIVVGSSHAEPMLRSNVGEWDEKANGRFNYITNEAKVLNYWEDRVKQSKNNDVIYTMGMRGVHDSGMEGVKSPKEAVPLLTRIFKDQRDLLSKHIKPDITKVPQAFTMYKEVLDIYNLGLNVPDDVTLIWPDDNYGYIQRLNGTSENQRSGGAGVYYHVSYWGRPHDYLWLATTPPGLIREEMTKAYQMNAQNIWVLNVGDIKPSEYPMEMFLDMAYQIKPFLDPDYSRLHLQTWLGDIFGKDKAPEMTSILWKYYDLAFERKPEFMGWSRTEPTTQTQLSGYNHFYFGDEAQKRIDQYKNLEKDVAKLAKKIDSEDMDAYYQLVQYPVVGASLMNKKFLYRDKSVLYARQKRASSLDYAEMSRQAYREIERETAFYNNQLSQGKWKYMMSMKPRNLPVFQEPVVETSAADGNQVWNIATEGIDPTDSASVRSGKQELPVFTRNGGKYFVDLFLTGSAEVDWNAVSSAPWIVLSESKGKLGPVYGAKDRRIWVSVDWTKVPVRNSVQDDVTGKVTIKGAGKVFVIGVQAQDYRASLPGDYQGFIENNGYVSIFAKNFSRNKDAQSRSWKTLTDLGHAGSSLMAMPLHAGAVVDPEKEVSALPVLEYDFYTFNAAEPTLNVFTLPTHPVNKDHQLRYGVSIDDKPLKVIDFRTYGRSEEWKKNVLSNAAVRSIQYQKLEPGKHTLKIYMIDPGVILDRITIDLGGLKHGYSAIPETIIKKQNSK